MKFTTEELGQSEILLTIEVEADRAKKLLTRTAGKASQGIKVPGYRPGKAPFKVMLRRFGSEVMQQQFLQNGGEELIKEAIEESKIESFLNAQMELKEINWEPLVIKILVPIPPKVVLGDYREIRLNARPIQEVTEKDIESLLKRYQMENSVWEPVERLSEMGDMVSMIVTQKEGDDVILDKESVDYPLVLIEQNSNVDERLVQELVGLSAGQVKTFSITYPEDYKNEKYAGKEITNIVEVGTVKYQIVDPIDDEFAKAVGRHETLAEWKESLRQAIQRNREHDRDRALGHEVLNLIVQETTSIKWPLKFEESLLEKELAYQESQLKQQGLTLDAYLKVQNITKEDFQKTVHDEVVSQLKSSLVVSQIASLENVTVLESEILEYAGRVSAKYGEHVWEQILKSEQKIQEISNEILGEKIIFLLAKIATGEAPPLPLNGAEPESVVEPENATETKSAE